MDAEEPLLTRRQSILLAEEFKPQEGLWNAPDPFPNIAPSLLAAEHIKSYVEKTGLIFPFYARKGAKSPLKKAAYEGKIGASAYKYNDKGERVSILNPKSKALRIPANSIVFAECNLEFRLPEFIALRFNLQIQHVHRGLLLGTGPLVDPGFHGKLCIPLHNLTDKDYYIPLEQGLIWIEFTKTTKGTGELGRPPFECDFERFSDITTFLDKAASQYSWREPIPLRSSLPSAFKNAEQKAEEAANLAKQSKSSADTIRNISLLAGLGAVVGVFSLAYLFFSDLRDFKNDITPNVQRLNNEPPASILINKIDQSNTAIEALENEVSALKIKNEMLEREVALLLNHINYTVEEQNIE